MNTLQRKLNYLLQDTATLGLGQALKWSLAYHSKRPAVWLHPKDYAYPVLLRTAGSDKFTLTEIAASYSLPAADALSPIEYIVDVGGNIGLTAAYMASRFPEAKVVTVEPDKANFGVLQQNVAPYANITALNKGVFNQEGRLKITNPTASSNSFRLELSDDPTYLPTCIEAVTIAGLMRDYAFPRIDILKIDIEGGERYLLDDSAQEWLPHVKVLMIELHDRFYSGCSKLLFSQLAGYNYSMDVRDCTLVIYLQDYPH